MINLKLGKREIGIPDLLPLNVVRELDLDAADQIDPSTSKREQEMAYFDRMIRAVSLAASDPPMMVEEVLKTPCRYADLSTAYIQIMLTAGLMVVKKDSKPGESIAGELSGPISGDSSTVS